MDTHDSAFWQDVQKITASWCDLNGILRPESCRHFTPEELAPIKERVAQEMSKWGVSERLDWKKP